MSNLLAYIWASFYPILQSIVVIFAFCFDFVMKSDEIIMSLEVWLLVIEDECKERKKCVERTVAPNLLMSINAFVGIPLRCHPSRPNII